MNWFKKLVNTATRAGHREIQRLTMLDGKSGLSIGDIEMLLNEIRKLSAVAAGGSEKHRMAVSWLVERLGSKIPRGFAEVIVYLAYQLIKDKLINKK